MDDEELEAKKREQAEKEYKALTAGHKFDLSALAQHFGGDWCDCIDKVLYQLTPKKLAVYCMKKGYSAYPKPIEEDGVGVRYSYFLEKVKEKKAVGDKEENVIIQERSVVAAFGDFHLRPYETTQSILQAIGNIAIFEERPAQKVAEDVVTMDEGEMPSFESDKAEKVARIFNPGHKRYVQDHAGLRPI